MSKSKEEVFVESMDRRAVLREHLINYHYTMTLGLGFDEFVLKAIHETSDKQGNHPE